MNIATLLDQGAERHPERAAIIDERRGRNATYGQLKERAAAVASALIGAGMKPGDRVLVGTPMSLDLYVALLGIWRAGLVAVAPDASAGLRELGHCLQRALPEGLILPARLGLLPFAVPALGTIPHRFAFRRFPGLADLDRVGGAAPCIPREDDRPALLTFTSGSTGEPKAAIRSHAVLHAQLDAILANMRLGGTTLETMPIALLANLAAGGTSVIPDQDLKAVGCLDGNRLAESIRRRSCTTVIASPAVLDVVSAARGGRRDDRLDGLQDVYTGGAPVFPRTLAAFAAAAPAARLHAVYGSTEAEPIAHIDYAEMDDDDMAAMRSGRGLLAGKAVPQTRAAIIRSCAGRTLGPWSEAEFEAARRSPGEVGEIVVAGPHVLDGYDRGVGDEETKIRVGETIWHRTGDAGRMDERERLWLLGRASAVIDDSRGAAYPLAVECAMSFRAGIRRSALVSIDGRRILAIESETTQATAPAGIDRMIRLERIPVDRRHNAKTDYPALRKALGRL